MNGVIGSRGGDVKASDALASVGVGIGKPEEPAVAEDGTKPLADKRREKTAQKYAQGMQIHEAWSATAERPISRHAGHVGASMLRREPSFMARAQFLQHKFERSKTKSNTLESAMPDLSTRAGREQTQRDIVAAWYRGEARPNDANSAISALSKMYGDADVRAQENARPDPGAVLAYVIESRLDGATLAEAMVSDYSGGLQRVADACRRALGVDAVTVTFRGESVTSGKKATKTEAHNSIETDAGAVTP
jgi:hypothetical protein